MPLPTVIRSGCDVLVLAGEHRPGPAEAGRHLVADEQHVVRAGRGLRRSRRKPGGIVIMPAAACTIGSTTSAAVSLPRAARSGLELGEARRRALLLAAVEAVGVRVGDLPRREEQRLELRVEEIDSARPRPRRRCRRGRRCACSTSTRFSGRPPPTPVAERQLERDLDRLRARVGVEDLAEPRRARCRRGARPARTRGRSPGRAASSARRARAAPRSRGRARPCGARGRSATSRSCRRSSSRPVDVDELDAVARARRSAAPTRGSPSSA